MRRNIRDVYKWCVTGGVTHNLSPPSPFPIIAGGDMALKNIRKNIGVAQNYAQIFGFSDFPKLLRGAGIVSNIDKGRLLV